MPLQTLLLADKDRDSLTIYSLMLEHHGYRVLRVRDAEEGFRLACAEGPVLVVTELFLGGPRGRPCLAERLKQDPRTAHLPVVGVSALAVYADHACYAACDVYLPKPCAPSRLLLEVRGLLATPAATV